MYGRLSFEEGIDLGVVVCEDAERGRGKWGGALKQCLCSDISNMDVTYSHLPSLAGLFNNRRELK